MTQKPKILTFYAAPLGSQSEVLPVFGKNNQPHDHDEGIESIEQIYGCI